MTGSKKSPVAENLLAFFIPTIMVAAIAVVGIRAERSEPREIAQPVIEVVADEWENVDYHLDERLPVELRNILLENRKDLLPGYYDGASQDFSPLQTQGLDPETDRGISGMVEEFVPSEENMMMFASLPYWLTREEVASDIAFLFSYLKYGYGGYQYFGGDEAFIPIRDQLLDQVAKGEYTIGFEEFQEMLLDGLGPLIYDNHFFIQGLPISEPGYIAFDETLDAARTADGFIVELEGKKRLLSVDGNPPDDYMIPRLGASGEIGWMVSSDSEETSRLLLEDVATGDTAEHEADLSFPGNRVEMAWDDSAYYQRDEVDGIPIIKVRSFMPDVDRLDQQEQELKEYIKDAATLRGEPVFIVDLRGNSGGYMHYWSDWLDNLKRDPPQPPGAITTLLTETAGADPTALQAYLSAGQAAEEGVPYWSEPIINYPIPENNSQLIFVLTDNWTASSAEEYILTLRQMANVVLVGVNTRGCLAMGGMRYILLPESKMLIQCGAGLILNPDLTSIEETGIYPDLWCPPEEALDRVVQFIEKHGLAA